MKKVIKVSAIENGTVIDHIPSGRAMKIINYLKSDSNENVIMVGINFKSGKMGRKDVIKIENKELTPEEVNQLAVFAQGATITIIRNFGKIKKYKVKVPKIFNNVIKCPNPNCITNDEEIKTKFQSFNLKPLKVKCLYCERIFKEDEIILK